MNPLEIFEIALRALMRNKTRSFLTTLGIIIGVGAVIVTVAIGEGAKAKVAEAFSSMGTNLLVVQSGTTTTGGVRGGSGSMPTLTWEDLTAIETEVPSVRNIAPLLRSTIQIVGDDQNWMTQIQGTSPEYFDLRNWGLSSGTMFTQSDLEGSNKVILLGATVATQLFGGGNPLGQTVRLRDVPFLVTGILEKKGQSSWGQDYDDVAFVPYTTFGGRIQGGLSKYLRGTIFVGMASEEAVSRAQTQITNLLRDRHQIPPGGDDDFSIRNLTEIANAQAEGTETLSLLLASIAAVSLLVGGIGIMNIMLVSVTERTREIGVRMAIGAQPQDILAQFLVESVALSMLGGIFGFIVGFVSANRLAASFGWPLLIRPMVPIGAIAFSAIVGVVFGLYPARKASRLDPIDALRYE